MKKVLGFISVAFLLLSASPNGAIRELVEYPNLTKLAYELEEGLTLNEYHYEVQEINDIDLGLLYLPQATMRLPLIDVVVYDDVYGETLFSDTLLRSVVHLSEYYHLDILYILMMIQVTDEPSLDRTQLSERVSWFYRIRALGLSEKYVLSEYGDLPKGFFK